MTLPPEFPISPSPIRVVVRSHQLVRLGQVDDYRTLSLVSTFNQVGHWEMEVSARCSQLDNLLTPGNGILILREHDGAVEYSGVIEEIVEDFSADQQLYRLRGRDDNGFLADRLALPDINEQFYGTTYEEAVIADNPMGYWRLGELEGMPLAADSSGNVNGGSYYGTANHGIDGAVRGDSGGVEYTSAAAGYAILPIVALPVHISVEAWIKFTSAASMPVLSDRQVALLSRGSFYFGTTNGHAFIYIDSTGASVEGHKLMNDNLWHHMVWTADGSTLRLYVDGQQDAVLTSAWTPWNIGQGVMQLPGVTALGTGTIVGGAAMGVLQPAGFLLTATGISSTPTPTLAVTGPSAAGHGSVAGALQRMYLAWDFPSAQRFIGGIDELAIYPSALSAERIQAHYDARLNTGYDVRGGTVEAVMRGFADGNCGGTALPQRRVTGFVLDDYHGLGPNVVEQARFANLLDLLRALAVKGADTRNIPLGFRLQYSTAPATLGQLVFTVYQPRDLADRVVYSPALQNVLRYGRTAPKAPQANFVYLGGKGILTGRVIQTAQDNDSIASWGRREVFKDRRDTADSNILLQTATQELAFQAAKEAVQVEPIAVAGLIYGQDYVLGDTVSFINRLGILVHQVVYEVEVRSSQDEGLRIVPKIGPASALDPQSATSAIETIDQRISKLETT